MLLAFSFSSRSPFVDLRDLLATVLLYSNELLRQLQFQTCSLQDHSFRLILYFHLSGIYFWIYWREYCFLSNFCKFQLLSVLPKNCKFRKVTEDNPTRWNFSFSSFFLSCGVVRAVAAGIEGLTNSWVVNRFLPFRQREFHRFPMPISCILTFNMKYSHFFVQPY